MIAATRRANVMNANQSTQTARALHTAVHQHTIAGLDAMRAIAITLVVLMHSGVHVSGELGVVIFFVLSGF